MYSSLLCLILLFLLWPLGLRVCVLNLMASVLDIRNQQTQHFRREPLYKVMKVLDPEPWDAPIQSCQRLKVHSGRRQHEPQTHTSKMLHALFVTRKACRSRAAWVYYDSLLIQLGHLFSFISLFTFHESGNHISLNISSQKPTPSRFVMLKFALHFIPFSHKTTQ